MPGLSAPAAPIKNHRRQHLPQLWRRLLRHPPTVGTDAAVATISCHGPPWAAGATSLNEQPDHKSGRGDAATVLICDKLTMLVTGDPVTELDSALNYAAQRLREAATNGDDAAAASLVAWIDHRLDERLTFTARDAAISLDAVDVIGRPRGTGAD